MTDEGAAVSHDDRTVPTPRHVSDPVERARTLHEVYDAVLSGDRHPHRAALARLRLVAPQPGRPCRPGPPRPARRRTGAPTSTASAPRTRSGAVLPLLRSTLVSIADEAVHVMIVTDADGTILWREGAPQPAARGRLRRARAGHALVRRRDRHERDGHRARRRQAGADPLRRAPGPHRPLVDLRGRPRPRPGHRHADRRHRHQRPAAHGAPGDGAAGRGHGAAGREPAAGPPRDR